MQIINEYNFKKIRFLRRGLFWLVAPAASILLTLSFRTVILFILTQFQPTSPIEITIIDFLHIIQDMSAVLIIFFYTFMVIGIPVGLQYMLRKNVDIKIDPNDPGALQAKIDTEAVVLDALESIIKYSLVGVLSLMIGSFFGGPAVMYVLHLISKLFS